MHHRRKLTNFSHKKIIVAPLVEKFTFPANLTQGKRLRVICTVAEGDLPLEVIWKKNGIPILINPGVQGNNVQVRGDKNFTQCLIMFILKMEHFL